MLLNVALCAACGGPLYRRPHRKARDSVIRLYYQCRNSAFRPVRGGERCRARIIPMAELDAAADDAVMRYGWVDVMLRAVVPPTGHARELAEVGRAIADLTTERYVRGVSRPDFDDVMARLQAEHARLAELPPGPEQVTYRPTGQTIEQLWPTLDTPGKWAYLLKLGVRMHAQRDADGGVRLAIESEGYWHDVAILGGFENAEAAADFYLTRPVKAALAERGLPDNL